MLYYYCTYICTVMQREKTVELYKKNKYFILYLQYLLFLFYQVCLNEQCQESFDSNRSDPLAWANNSAVSVTPPRLLLTCANNTVFLPQKGIFMKIDDFFFYMIQTSLVPWFIGYNKVSKFRRYFSAIFFITIQTPLVPLSEASRCN